MDLSGKSFYKLIKARFVDTWDEVSTLVPLDIDELDPEVDKKTCLKKSYEMLDHDTNLGLLLTGLFSFYAGRILEDGRSTNLYKGPADHRTKTLLESYVNDANLLVVLHGGKMKSEARKDCYLHLKSIGTNLNKKG